MRKLIASIIIVFTLYGLLFFLPRKTFSLECDQYQDGSEQKQSCLNQLIPQLQQKLNTTKAQINLFDAQISLIISQIQQTQDKVTSTQNEIDILGSRITGLDTSLNYLSKLLIERIFEGYKQRNVSLLNLLLDSNSAGNLINKIQYYKATQDNNQKLLIQVEESKQNFEEQKQLREQKVQELDNLKITLAQQQTDLKNKQVEAQRIKEATETDLANAQAELAAFSRFAEAAGGGTTTFGNGSNGWYYTQRDPQWAGMTLPGSSSTVMLAGCAVTSVAMVCKSYGQNITPATIASDPGDFIGGDLWNSAFGCSGKTTDWIGNSEDRVKSYVKSGTPVILRLVAPSVSGLHFVVAFKWDDGKNDFIIHDPYFGPDNYFSGRYSWSQVTTAIAIH